MTNKKKILPGESIDCQLIENLKRANLLKKQKKKNFSWYKKEIKSIFGVSENAKISVKYKNFYGGFVAGEGSINVSAKKNKNALFGILIDPEFSITQHINGLYFLFTALSLFETGSIHYKQKSKNTLVYRIDNRKSIIEKVIPFWETYISPYTSKEQKQRIIIYKKILFLLEEKKHKDLFFFVNQILPLWDKLRKQKGQKNESFPNLETAKSFAVRKGSSETVRDLI